MDLPDKPRGEGYLIVIDGIDGWGKTTQVKLLYERLLQEG
jgi:thymidylate kinase